MRVLQKFLRAVAAWLALAGLPLLSAAQTISQPLDSGGGFSGNVGQSFVATLTGNVVAVDVRSLFASSTTIHFYPGSVGSGIAGAMGAPTLSVPVTLVASGGGGPFSHMTLTTPFPVVAGQTYSFVVQGASLFSRNVDTYAGGTVLSNWAVVNVASDLAFQIFEEATADLQVGQTASSTAATVGSTIGYAITFTNAGPHDATTVTVSDNLAAGGLALLSAQSSVGVLTTSSNSLSLALGTLTSGASATITIVASVSAGAGSITHTVSISSSATDPALGNNTATHFASRLAAPPPVATPVAVPASDAWSSGLLALVLAALGATAASLRRTGRRRGDAARGGLH